MARRRKGEITESIERLKQLEEQYRGKPEAARVKVLRLLKDQPDLGIDEAAVLVNYSKQAVKRWLRIYREEGLDAVIGLSRGGKRPAKANDLLIMLRQKLTAGEFSNIDQVVEWLTTTMGANRQDGAGSDWVRRESAFQLPHEQTTNGSRLVSNATIPNHVLRFLTLLPATHDVQEWTTGIRAALRTLLGDVDHISLSLNAQCDLLNPKAYSPTVFVMQNVDTGNKEVKGDAKRMSSEESHSDRYIDQLRRKGFPFEKYHPPKSFIYYYGGSAYLGVVVLWREREKLPISESTIWLMEQLREFMVFLLSDFVARHRYAKPIDSAFNEALERLIQQAELTTQERRIVILQMLGFTYDEMADTLNISTNTLRYHLKSVYSKTGAHSQAELFAKYFTPRFDPHKANE